MFVRPIVLPSGYMVIYWRGSQPNKTASFSVTWWGWDRFRSVIRIKMELVRRIGRCVFCGMVPRRLVSVWYRPWQPDGWASCQIRKMPGAHAPGMPGTFSPLPQVSDPDMHHGTCVTHVPWCMSGSLTSGFLWNRRRGKTFPAFPAHAQPAILRIW